MCGFVLALPGVEFVGDYTADERTLSSQKRVTANFSF